MMLGGLMMPTSVLPATLQRIALALPATHAMNAWNALSMGQPSFIDPTWSLLVLLSGGVISFGLAALLFNWDSRNRQGRLPNTVALLAFVPYILSAIFLG
jgi:ABC-type multidrug transport system permease subunit